MEWYEHVHTYRRDECAVFRKTKEQFGGLSNMASGYSLNVNGVEIRTAEALYQACRFPDCPDVQRAIIAERSPMAAKMRGRPFLRDARPDWQAVNIGIMRWCLHMKLAQHIDTFGGVLLSTDERSVVEDSARDDF
jgi:type I restriction enzyme S subunit